MKNKAVAILISVAMIAVLGFSNPVSALAESSGETVIVLADSGVTVDGETISTSADAAVYGGAQIVYYESGHDSSYGEGTAGDEHTAAEAAKHKVVTITKPGSYRISGTLAAGQIAVDLGSAAEKDTLAVVELILDGANLTCSVAPGIIFYNVWESESNDTAGAIITLADGSANTVNGSYVARIYKPGTTDKLHKYDGAVYSKKSMIVRGEAEGSGQLTIEAANEGLDSEMHLTVDGGNYQITAADDGLNANEDGVSVIQINDGYMFINAGNGSEGDGIDSNGYLYINGGTVIALANPRAGDGGIDADMDIVINGGTVIALGSRNDSASANSKQPFMELSYASTKAANSQIRITDSKGAEIMSYNPVKAYQSFTYSSPSLALDTVYYVYSNGIQQQYTGNAAGGPGGTGGMTPGGGGFNPVQAPDGLDAWLQTSTDIPLDIKSWLESAQGISASVPGARPTMGAGDGFNSIQAPTELDAWLQTADIPADIKNWLESVRDLLSRVPQNAATRPAMTGNMPGMPSDRELGTAAPDRGTNTVAAAASPDFIITAGSHSFGNVTDYTQASDKTAVTFRVNTNNSIASVNAGAPVTISYAGAALSNGDAVTIPEADVQFTITDVPSEDYSAFCKLSDGAEALAQIIPADEGSYLLTIAVVDSNTNYTGSNQWSFTIHDADHAVWPFADVAENNETNWYYSAVKYAYENNLMKGVSQTSFAPGTALNRAMAVTILGQMADAQVDQNAAASFSDVVKDGWSNGYMVWAAEKGIMNGYSANISGQYENITREQICVLLVNYAQFAGIDLKANTPAVTFSDSNAISTWAADAVGVCQKAGLAQGIGNNQFAPQANLTRAEAAVIFMNFALKFGR